MISKIMWKKQKNGGEEGLQFVAKEEELFMILDIGKKILPKKRNYYN